MAKKLLDYKLDDLYEWIESGKAPEGELALYVNLLDKIRGMMQRKDIYGNKEAIIKHLINFEEGMTRYKAVQFYSESIEYFNTQTIISQRAWRNLYADELDRLYDLAVSLAQTTGDSEKASKIKERAAKIRGLDQEEPEKIPASLFTRPNKIYTMDMNMFEAGAVDRTEAIAWVEENGKKLTAKAIDRIKQEIGFAEKIKIFYDETEDPRKD